MSAPLHHNKILVLGSGGRLGCLLRSAWQKTAPGGVELWFQSSAAMAQENGVIWSPGEAPSTLPPCDTVIALWGETAGDAAALAANTWLAHQSRLVAQSCGASRVLHFSSAAIYGPVHNAVEETPASPINPYGHSKHQMEQAIGDFDDDLNHICLRLANVVGADSLAPALRGDGPVTLDRFANGRGPLRSYIGAGDLAQVLIGLTRLPAADLPHVLNVTAPTPVAMENLVRAAKKPIRWRDAPTDALQHVTLAGSRLARLLPDIVLRTDSAQLIVQWKRLEGGQ